MKKHLPPAGVLITVAAVSGQAVLPAVPVSAAVLRSKLSGNGALVAASVVHNKLGEHATPEGIELSHDFVAVSNKMVSIATVHVTNIGVLVIAGSMVMSEHFVELAPVSVLDLSTNSQVSTMYSN